MRNVVMKEIVTFVANQVINDIQSIHCMLKEVNDNKC